MSIWIILKEVDPVSHPPIIINQFLELFLRLAICLLIVEWVDIEKIRAIGIRILNFVHCCGKQLGGRPRL